MLIEANCYRTGTPCVTDCPVLEHFVKQHPVVTHVPKYAPGHEVLTLEQIYESIRVKMPDLPERMLRRQAESRFRMQESVHNAHKTADQVEAQLAEKIRLSSIQRDITLYGLQVEHDKARVELANKLATNAEELSRLHGRTIILPRATPVVEYCPRAK